MFYGREEHLSRFAELWRKKVPSLVVCRGRRRVGKSTLIKQFAAKSGARWREELVAKSIARSYAGAATALTEKGARQLVEELSACRMPYVDPRNKPTMIFTSTRELDRKFVRDRPT